MMLVKPNKIATKVNLALAALLLIADINDSSIDRLNALISFCSLTKDWTVRMALIFSPAIAEAMAILS